jgi:hypothetical protein
VERLIAEGADVAIASPAGFATPLGWAALASGQDQPPGRDHLRAGKLLVAAGDRVERRIVDAAGGPLRDWLETRCA